MWMGTGLGFVGTVIAARGLGIERYGAVILATSITALIAALLDVSLEAGVVHHGFRALADADFGRLRMLLRTALAVDVVVGAAVFFLLLILAGPLAWHASLGQLHPGLVRLAALGTLAETANGTTGAMLVIARRPDLRAWSMMVARALRVMFVAVAVRMDGASPVLVAFALAAGLGAMTQGALAWRAGWKTWTAADAAIRPGPSPASLLRFGAYASVTSSIQAIRGALLPVLLGRFADPGAVGLLNVAYLPVSASNIALAPVRLAVYPEQAGLAARGERTALLAGFRFHALLGLGIGIPAAIAGWFLLPWLLPLLYSARFDAAVWPARVLLIVAVVQLTMGAAKALPLAIGHPEFQTLAAILELIALVLLVMMLGHRGVMGAAVALATVSIFGAIILWMTVLRILGDGSRHD